MKQRKHFPEMGLSLLISFLPPADLRWSVSQRNEVSKGVKRGFNLPLATSRGDDWGVLVPSIIANRGDWPCYPTFELSRTPARGRMRAALMKDRV